MAEKKIETITADVEAALDNYITDTSVTVKLTSNYISHIGEVNMPDRYSIYKDRLSIYQALAMRSDMSDYSNRQQLQLIHQTARCNVVKEFTFTDISILSSEFFYFMPNDDISPKLIKGKLFHQNAFHYGIIISTFTLFFLVYNVVR